MGFSTLLLLFFFLIGILNVTIITSSRRVNVTDRIVMSCFVIGGPNDLNITLYKASQVIGLTHRTKVESEFRQSNLTIRDVLAEDEGNYTCYAAWVLYFLKGLDGEMMLSRGECEWKAMGNGEMVLSS